jgi:hypothetical protein
MPSHARRLTLKMNDALIADPVRSRQILERIPAQRWGKPSDFEGAIVFLASQASDYVSGECLVVDGGWMGRECCVGEVEVGMEVSMRADVGRIVELLWCAYGSWVGIVGLRMHVCLALNVWMVCETMVLRTYSGWVRHDCDLCGHSSLTRGREKQTAALEHLVAAARSATVYRQCYRGACSARTASST